MYHLLIDYNFKASNLKAHEMKKVFGYLLFILSFVVWGLVALLPILELSKGEIATATTLLIISGEVSFLAAIALLGKEFWSKIKSIFIANK
jgi:hypothetical protein